MASSLPEPDLTGGHDRVGAALCRDRAAARPQGFSIAALIAGAASRPDRDTRPLLQESRQSIGFSGAARIGR
ncbi:hypothetical protein CXG45_09470 [Pseudomonas plecoglossicida]|uniref:Uncharacterized protein n=1 Tax=Pseudomonas plecoglossicida TaxID=70775 RepID=A0ABX4U3K6_PSEDL|nr:hypothetical protein CXG44_04975 [Pseudomonas plecoglossicida]PLU93804.1 hypothetical protein CXG45_09470 [Pseudomonas plecoglossicida]PLV04557.1 hypothetical protein CXG48_09330 [Pseudomonas plecoglossicida]PLV13896.1 hypothetical protein CXG47_13895 [Pseudomonas plecoglossicida]